MKIPKCLIDEFDYYSSKSGETGCRIMWRGRWLTVRSGKTMWKTKGQARAALISHLKCGNIPYFTAIENGVPKEKAHIEQGEFVYDILKHLEESFEIEYVEVK